MRGKINKEWAEAYGGILNDVIILYVINKTKFAHQINSSEESLRQWFTGRNFPSIQNHENICNVLEKEINELSTQYLDNEMLKSLKKHLKPLDQNIPSHIINKKIGKYLSDLLRICYRNGKNSSKRKQSKLVGNNEKTNKMQAVNNFNKTGKTQAVIFDFDGTLTKGNAARTTWESIWTELGYDVQDCRNLHDRYSSGQIDHDKWCKLTEKEFIAKNCDVKVLDKVVRKITLIKDCKNVFFELKSRNIKIFIVSGSILYIIQKVLKNLCQYIDDIKANDFKFSLDGFLTEIIGTRYDFQGKAEYIDFKASELRISKNDMLFIGNSNNDEWAHGSGVETLCINPNNTNSTNRMIWDHSIKECESLLDIFKYVKI
jgi:HAD superfamily phosphoserine phosphatase-like hydrolase